MYLLDLCMSSLEKCLFSSSAYFLVAHLFFVVELYELFIYFGDQALVGCIILQRFSPIRWVVFSFLFMVSFAVQKLLSLIRSYWIIFVFIVIILGGRSNKILLRFMSQSVLPMLSSTGFIVSVLMFRSLIHFEFIFVCGVRECSNFILLHVAVKFSQYHY